MQENKYKNLVNFKTNLNQPRHSWFDIKEGYSSLLVDNILEDLNISIEDGFILDPFSGSGTTVIQSSILGYKSIGIEVNPFLHFLSLNKSINFTNNIENLIKKFKDQQFYSYDYYEIPKLSISKKLFRDQLIEILKIKKWIYTIDNKKIKDLFLCIFLCSLDRASFAKKDGNGLKYPLNKKTEIFFDVFNENLNKFINDIKNVEIITKPEIFLGNNLDILKDTKFIKKYQNNVSLCLFSPPYANCFDYTEVYKTELWFGDFIKEYKDLKVLRNQSMSSHLNKDLKNVEILEEINLVIRKISSKKLWSKKILNMLINYFYEMNVLLKLVYPLLNEKGKCVIVIGNSSYGNIAIPTDQIFEKLAKKIGYKKTYIIEARKLGTSSQQLKNVDDIKKLRESLVVLSKC
jgi:hypothetical protein